MNKYPGNHNKVRATIAASLAMALAGCATGGVSESRNPQVEHAVEAAATPSADVYSTPPQAAVTAQPEITSVTPPLETTKPLIATACSILPKKKFEALFNLEVDGNAISSTNVEGEHYTCTYPTGQSRSRLSVSCADGAEFFLEYAKQDGVKLDGFGANEAYMKTETGNTIGPGDAWVASATIQKGEQYCAADLTLPSEHVRGADVAQGLLEIVRRAEKASAS